MESAACHHTAFVPWRGENQPVSSGLTSPGPDRDRPPVALATVGLLALYRRVNPDFRFFQSVPRRCLTRPSQGVYNNEYDNHQHDYILYVNDTLSDDHGNEYAVLDLLGTGTFGQVVKCRHQRTGEVVAVKVIKNQPAYFNQAWVEINILRMLHRNNRPEDTRHIVKCYSHFVFRDHLCLVFERLSINLYQLLKQNNYVGVSLEMLRNFLSQILQALDVLVQSEVIHCDLKPENILLKALDTAQLKIIDFGSACQLHYPVYSYVQSRFYRSPEVLLGWPDYDSKIDMWSLGCVAGELFLGIPLFPGQNEMNMICRIVEMLGDMPDRFLRRCRQTTKFFNCPRGEYGEDMHVFQLKSVAQYEQENSTTLPQWKRFFKEKKLRDIIMTYPPRTAEPHTEEIALRESLIDLLNGMLRVDPRDRWAPGEALQHPFVQGKPLPGGQPWTPPTRPRRIMRSRPVFIEQFDDSPSPIDSLYSASAPNFNAKGRLAMNTTWGTGAGGQPMTKPSVNVGYQTHHQGVAAYGFGEQEPAVGTPAFAPGSYIPSSTLSMFGQNLSMQGPLPPPPPLAQGTSRRAPPALGGSYSGASHDPRAFLYPPVTSGGDHLQRGSIGGIPENQTAVMAATGTPPLPYAAALRLGDNLRMSGSKESLSGSLRLSGSRESLGMGRTNSVGDMEDPMFAFGSDDEGFSSAQGMQPQPPQQQTMPMGASAALPPPGPRLPTGRGGPAAYGNPSTLASYGYTYTTQQHGSRVYHPITGLPPTSVDVGMSDISPDLHRTAPQEVVNDGNFPGAFGTSPDVRMPPQDDAVLRQNFPSRRKIPRGS